MRRIHKLMTKQMIYIEADSIEEAQEIAIAWYTYPYERDELEDSEEMAVQLPGSFEKDLYGVTITRTWDIGEAVGEAHREAMLANHDIDFVVRI